MNVDDIIRIKIEDARRKVEAARRRRAEMEAARSKGLAQRHAAKLRAQAARRPDPPGVATPATDDPTEGDQP